LQIRNVWQACEFSDDVKFGRLDPSRFAVELHSVLDGTADSVYIDPKLFLSNTYPTSNMKFILREALRRLSARGGQPVFILDTEFGGGKTHTLLLLYHVFKNKDLGTNYIRELGLDKEVDVLEVPEVRVVAIDCRKVKRKTLWGELADNLGSYEDFEAEDSEMHPVHDIEKIKALFKEPTLILMDELPDYLLKAAAKKVGEVTLSDLTLSFVLNLISAVASTRYSMLIISLTGKQSLYERYVQAFKSAYQRTLTSFMIEELHQKATEVFSRQAQYVVPIEKDEVSMVIKRRLVKTVKDESEVKRLVKAYCNYYREKGIISDPSYEEKLENSYPFHPFLIDVLYDRISTIEEFNKTRGMLRLLAMVLHRIYRDRVECKVVSPGDIPIHDPEIKDELTSKLGKGELRPVIETDCVNKARSIDEKRKVRIAEKVARTIYVYSLIGAAKISGIRPGEIKLAVCQPGVDPALVDDILKEIEEDFWYLKSEAGAYYFDKEPNINKIIYDYKNEVRSEEVRGIIQKTLETLLPNVQGVECVVWEREKLKDDPESLKIFAVDYKEIERSNELSVIENIFENRFESGIRSYRNTIIMLLPDKDSVNALFESAVLLRAIEKAKMDERIKLDKDRLKKIAEKLETTKGHLVLDCQNVYSRVAYPRVGDGKIQVDDIGFEEKRTITEMVLSLLRKRGKLVDNLSPSAILDVLRPNGAEKEKIQVKDVYNLFRTDRRKPFILSGSVVLDAVKSGVRQGLFGYSRELVEKEGKYLARFKTEVFDVSWEGWIINPEAIYFKKEEEEEKRGKEKEGGGWTPPPHYIYNLECGSLDEVVENLMKLKVLSVGRSLDVRLSLNLSNDSEDSIVIDSKFRKPSELESLLNILKSKGYSGNGSFRISSQEDLSEEFKKYGVKGCSF
jgi:predicted AAA+ superfamily ATPase